jgi:hypothetical protein
VRAAAILRGEGGEFEEASQVAFVAAARPIRVLLCLIFAGLSGLAVGCGLGEYEKQMELQQELLDYMEEENKVLEPLPILLPALKEKGKIVVPANHFFYRPPKGISISPVGLVDNLLYEFDPLVRTSPITAIYAASAKVNKADKDDKFQTEVLRLLSIGGKKKVVTVRAAEGKPKTLDAYEETTPKGVTTAYFNKQDPGGEEGVIVIHLAPGGEKDSAVKNAIDKSLASFLCGKAAFQRHRTYKPIGAKAIIPSTTGNTPIKLAPQ